MHTPTCPTKRESFLVLTSLLALLFSFVPSLCDAGANHWTRIGPYREPGDATAIAVDPRSPSTVFAGASYSGVFRSTDAGATWRSLEASPRVNDLLVDPVSSAVYAATPDGVYRSTDAGISWLALNNGLPSSRFISDLEIEPLSPSTLYASIPHNPAGVFKTTDGGSSWAALPLALDGFHAPELPLAVDPRSPGTLYAGTMQGLFRSSDGGASWQLLALPGLPGTGILLVEVDPASSAVYAGKFDGLFKSSDLGATWSRLEGGLPASGAKHLAIAREASGSLLYAMTYYEGILRSADGGASWTDASAGLPALFGGSALAVSPVSSATLYSGFFFHGLFRSTDGGRGWIGPTGSFRPVPVNRVRTHPSAPNTIWAGSAGPFDGILRSDDRGRTWSARNEGLTILTIRQLEIAPASPAVLYAGTDAGVFRTANGGESWQLANGGLPNAVSALAVDPVSASTIYAASYTASSAGLSFAIYKSVNGGGSWTIVRAGLAQYVGALAAAPGNPTTIYAGLGYGGGVLRSSDGGLTWSSLTIEGVAGNSIVSLAIDPTSPMTIYAVSAFTGLRPPGVPFPGYVFKSTDGGLRWTRILQTLDPVSVAVNPFLPNEVYVGAPILGGLLRSRDGGASWETPGEGLDFTANSVAFAPGTPATVYAGTSLGVFEAAFSPTDGSCAADATTLCLRNARFAARVAWRASAGTSGAGQAVTLTSHTGAFWFFQSPNLELMVKVLDGRAINGRFWVFCGSLTDVEFTLTVTDTQTGAVRTYSNPPGQLASFGDTEAF
jgi:photosystem II stability/assembly factor-like uncharacterized protein